MRIVEAALQRGLDGLVLDVAVLADDVLVLAAELVVGGQADIGCKLCAGQGRQGGNSNNSQGFQERGLHRFLQSG